MEDGTHIDWRQLTHAHGSAEDVPRWLEALRASDAESRQDAQWQLCAVLFHEGEIYPATPHAIAPVMRACVDPDHPSFELVEFLAEIAYAARRYASSTNPEQVELGQMCLNALARALASQEIREAEQASGTSLAPVRRATEAGQIFEQAARENQAELDMALARRLQARFGGHWMCGRDRFRATVTARGHRLHVDGMCHPVRKQWVVSVFRDGECLASGQGDELEHAVENAFGALKKSKF